MPTFFSDHFSSGAGQTSLPTHPIKTPQGINGGPLRMSRGYISDPSDAFAAADVLRFFQLPSAARIYELYIISDAVFTGGTVDVGLHKAGNNHDGAVIDADLFASAVDVFTAEIRTEIFGESTTFEEDDRGKPLWALANEGAGTYTEDPNETWEITGTLGGTPAGAGNVGIECWWTADDG